ncbi:MAG: cytidylyltransferase domain-containing protein [Candidatus Saccharibacteria bacterium]
MKVVLIIQARMTSTRLPGKILREIMGKPLLQYQIERLRKVDLAHEIVIATTANNSDQPVVELCSKLGVKYFRGPEDDVLERFYRAALENQADVVVRLTGDCPVIDPLIVNKVIGLYLDNQDKVDYVSNVLQRTYPRGMDTEVFSFQVLREAFNEAAAPAEREHVTPFIYGQPNRYRLANVAYTRDESRYRWTVDTPDDFELIKRIIESLYPIKHDFTLEDMLDLFDKNSEWYSINSHVEQKKIGE